MTTWWLWALADAQALLAGTLFEADWLPPDSDDNLAFAYAALHSVRQLPLQSAEQQALQV